MYPEIGSIGSFTLHSFGLMIAVAVLASGWLLSHGLKEHGLRPGLALEIAIAAAAGGALGARLYYLIEHRGEAGASLASGSGLVWYGGVVGGVLGVVAVARWRRLCLGVVANAVAPALALGYAIGRIGCQLAGDGTYGQPSDLPWAMSYPDGTVPTRVGVHPTPVYEALAMIFVFWALWRLRGRLVRPWSLFGLYAVLAGTERLLVEFIRINPVEVFGLTAPQLFSVAQIALGVALLVGILVTRRQPLRPALT